MMLFYIALVVPKIDYNRICLKEIIVIGENEGSNTQVGEVFY